MVNLIITSTNLLTLLIKSLIKIISNHKIILNHPNNQSIINSFIMQINKYHHQNINQLLNFVIHNKCNTLTLFKTIHKLNPINPSNLIYNKFLHLKFLIIKNKILNINKKII